MKCIVRLLCVQLSIERHVKVITLKMHVDNFFRNLKKKKY